MGRGLMGTVTEVAADHYTIKTETGETYTVHYSANTRILKQQARARGESGERGAGGEGGPGGGGGGNPPTPLKSTDIKVGDAIAAMGELDATAKSVGATMVMQIDPERAKQMREMQANYGKTWLMGKVTAIDGVKVTLMGVVDNTARSFVADENTTFRKRRDPITLADIQVGDTVRVEGALKDGAFLATQVSAMGPPPGGAPNVPRNSPPPATPQ
jgi:preprotein translocase subunit YajC